LPKIKAPEAWEITTGTDIIIAIVDTGVDLNHPDLNDKIVAGYDFVNNDDTAQDDHGHGTHVAGIAAAETDNATGVAGVSWGAKIMPVKVLDASGSGSYSDVAEGVLYACDHGAQIINLSLGGDYNSATLRSAVQTAHADGCLIVAAAGNGYGNGVDYPARYEVVMAVAATTSSDKRASFSDYGPEVDVAAPGVSICSTFLDDTYNCYYGGTSMATPHVAGLAALVWSANSCLTNDQVRDLIESTADDLGSAGKDNYFGWGRINAHQAVVAAAPTLTASPSTMFFLADDLDIVPSSQTIQVGNGAPCGSLDWTASESADWLDISPSSGSASPSTPGLITVTVTRPASTNIYTETIQITSSTPYVQGSPQTVTVTLHYLAALERRFSPLMMRNY
jgi:type VII secretion-associated serine protease mycosin